MSARQTLTEKERELAAVGASIAAGCQPCTAHHFAAARQAGATHAEIRQAVDDALSVRRSGTNVMAGLTEKLLASVSGADEQECDVGPLVRELVSAAAALALNCETSLQNHLGAAIRLGASDRQVRSVLGVARVVRKVAVQKAEAVAVSSLGSTSAAEGEERAGANVCGCPETRCAVASPLGSAPSRGG